jgi:hypothetical protein
MLIDCILSAFFLKNFLYLCVNKEEEIMKEVLTTMTAEKATEIFRLKYPSGEIDRRDIGRMKCHNFVFSVMFEEGCKVYEFKGASYLDVLVRLNVVLVKEEKVLVGEQFNLFLNKDVPVYRHEICYLDLSGRLIQRDIVECN